MGKRSKQPVSPASFTGCNEKKDETFIQFSVEEQTGTEIEGKGRDRDKRNRLGDRSSKPLSMDEVTQTNIWCEIVLT